MAKTITVSNLTRTERNPKIGGGHMLQNQVTVVLTAGTGVLSMTAAECGLTSVEGCSALVKSDDLIIHPAAPLFAGGGVKFFKAQTTFANGLEPIAATADGTWKLMVWGVE
jgi:hypothetical protein